jgi:F-type H+-transporting ATPase subunit gamma
MATLKVIRKRIASVRNTQKITKAMKMVAAAKLRRAQTSLFQGRPYTKYLKETLKGVAAHLEPDTSPFLQVSDQPSAAEVLVFTSDRGLCGGFNSNLLRRILYFLSFETQEHSGVQVSVIGRKGRDFFRAKKISSKKEISGLKEGFSFTQAMEMAQEILEAFKNGKFGAFYLAYNGFKSAISQEIQIQKILPLQVDRSVESGAILPVIYEPSIVDLFNDLLPRYVAGEIYLAQLESNASELGARMSAMENATNNAKEMIASLTLQYNRARQAAITKELMDIVNGAEALK